MSNIRTASLAAVIVAGALVASASCGPKQGKAPVAEPATMHVALPDVASKLELATSEPMEGHKPSEADPILTVMASEMTRWLAARPTTSKPPYYLSYQITERRVVSLEAEGGAIVSDEDDTDRLLDIDVRVGSPTLDNSRTLAVDGDNLNEPLARQAPVPAWSTGNTIAASQLLWLETDRRYREAAQALTYVEQDQMTLSKPAKAADFSSQPPENFVEPRRRLAFDKAQWLERLKLCSSRTYRGVVTRGGCGVMLQETTVWYVNSEGSKIQQSNTWAQMSVSVGVKADDGMGLSRLEQRYAETPAGLPDDVAVETIIKTVTDELQALSDAPLAEPYVGPAILEGRAAGVFFHEVFGHRIEGHRQKGDTSGKTFSAYVGKEIMPTWLTVYDDPRVRSLNGTWLNGFYRFDNQGVRAQHTPLVTNGVLKGFLMGRIPIDGFAGSNGHGRHSPGLPPVSRQGNLVVSVSKSVERSELERLLLEEIKKQGRPYGMIFTDISGGFTNTDVFAPQAFKVNPNMAYRLYPDGRRELVRGIDISGTPLVALQSIRAASRDVETFNGVCGAESGWVPVSASAPSLLIERLEIEKSFTPPDRPPVLSPPSIRASQGSR
ncbi:MAG: hypothetical protein IPL79_11395 [Myxococcales bacterium]|nr:hypothetical protein [Myxococcales bacterium]